LLRKQRQNVSKNGKRPLDIMVTPVDGAGEWRLTDLLGRSMGVIKEIGSDEFLIEPDGNAVATMDGMLRGPFRSLDEALAAIETRTRGVCRRGPDEA
jgi:hypothetical protein